MALPLTSINHVGQLLCFRPCYGWGWRRIDAHGAASPIDYESIDRAGAFDIRVDRFFSFEGELRGVVGRVEQSGHPFNGMWAATWTMNVGDYDLSKRLCPRWDIELGPVEPSGDGWPEFRDAPAAYLGNGGVLAISREAVTRWFEWFESVRDDARGGPP